LHSSSSSLGFYEAERAARAEAEAANKAKDQFLAVLSHELRTPLTSVMLGADSADEIPGLSRSGAAVDVIERNCDMQMRLVDDLRRVSQIVAGKLQLDRRPVEVGGLPTAPSKPLDRPRRRRRSRSK